MNAQIIATLIFQFALIISFITIFFFTFVKNVESQIIDNQIDRVMTDLSEELGLIGDSTITNSLRQIQLDKPNLVEEDERADNNNKGILKNAIKLLAILVPICLIISFLMVVIFKLSMKEMFILGFSGLFIVMIIEVIFLLVFAKNYRTLDSNVVKKGVVDSLIKYKNS